MLRVTIYDWLPGLQKIGLTRFLQEHCEMSLSQAKQKVDDLLDGQAFSFVLSDALVRGEFLSKLDSLMVKYIISPDKK